MTVKLAEAADGEAADGLSASGLEGVEPASHKVAPAWVCQVGGFGCAGLKR